MKNLIKALFLIVFLLCFQSVSAQNFYEQQWKTITENYQKGQYKSNLPIILKIQNQAIKDNNSMELIRSLKAEFSIVNQTSDDTRNDSASQFFKKLQSFEPKLKGEDQLLYRVLLGNFINDFYRNNQWKINQRTNVSNQDLTQLETWSKLDFKNYLNEHFSKLNEQNSVLKQVKLQKYKSIFENTQDFEYFPTLYDWNAVQYIDFMKNGNLFTPNELKVNENKIKEIYHQLIAQNQGNSKLYFQHQLLDYECENSGCKNRDEKLQQLIQSASEGDYKVMLIYDLAEINSLKNQNIEALKWISKAKAGFPKSKFLGHVLNLENGIKNQQLNIKFEQHTLPNQPIHLVAEHKNVTQFSLKIFEVKNDEQGFLNYLRNSWQKSNFSKIKKLLIREEQFTLPSKNDYQTYKTSLEINALPSGLYVGEYWVDNKNQETFYFIVTNSRIIYVNKDNQKEGNLLKLVNRENGSVLPSENIQLIEYQNNNFDKSETKTNQDGTFRLSNTDNRYQSYLVKNSGNNYNLFNDERGYYRNQSDENKIKVKAQIFLDRAIYRPSQTVYFKVINTKSDANGEHVNSGISQTIILQDVNNQEIASQKFITNEFGSYHGSFVLPKGKLNGNFSLAVKSDNINEYKSFRVEEYKRPNFEVSFEPIKEEYRYGQTIELKGKTSTFSGIPLSNAIVNYEVKKQNISWRYFPWYPRLDDNENSILGEVKTNEKGEFFIKIDLKKDENTEGIQVDNYQFSASVTDVNGETQQANTNLNVASVSHYIEAEQLENRFSDENVRVKVETKNYNNQNLKKSYQVSLSKLDEPQKVFRSQFRNAIQDLPKFTKTEFDKKFPNDRFDKEELREHWKISSVILNGIQKNEEQLDLGKLNAGTYKLMLYNIEGKDTIKTEQIFEVFNKTSLDKNQKPFLKVLQEKTELKPNEKSKIKIYSAIPNTIVNIFIQDGNGTTITDEKKLNNGFLEYEISAPKIFDFEVLNVQVQLVALNDVQTEDLNFKLISDKKPLAIETVTFRDKIEPNSKEKWTVKIVGDKAKSEKIQAEVLANMYDRSLDQFVSNRYYWTNIFNKNFIKKNYDVRDYLNQKYYSERERYIDGKDIDQPYFNWFNGGLIQNALYGRIRKKTNLEEVVIVGYGVKSKESITASASVLRDEESVEVVQNIIPEPTKAPKIETSPPPTVSEEKIPVRKNLNETAFFYPNLLTDKDGNVNFEFTSPEALTSWKFMVLAHTKDAQSAILEKEVVTQKQFSVSPNYPRFLREGDEINLQTRISSLVNQPLNGNATLQILDALTNEDITSKFDLNAVQREFNLSENQNTMVSWTLKVPQNVSSIIVKTIANAGQFSDGEQKAIPILPNRMLVTDAVPIFVKEGQSKTFVLDNLLNKTSKTATNVSTSLELSTNPIWEVMLALPSLKDDSNLSADVQFNKWFADVLASEIFKANPKLKTVFEEYQEKDLLKSNLDKNQELKQLLLEETPWILESKNETEQMLKISRLFDVNTMRNSIQQDWQDLKKLQNSDGGFSWYSGYPSSYSTSLYILKNLGKINLWLKGNLTDYQGNEQKEMVRQLVNYVDTEILKYKDINKINVWSNEVLNYLDTRNYWEKDFPLKSKGLQLKNQIIKKAPTAKITDFTFFGLHRSALLMDAYNLKFVSQKLLTYLKETSVQSETQGAYWKQNLNDWGWYSSKIVNHAGALEAFHRLTPNDINFIEEMKIWLLTQKDVSNWDTSRTTAEVIFTILNSGKSWTNNESEQVDIVWAGKPLNDADKKATGYIKKTIASNQIDADLGKVTVSKKGAGIVQGGLFWQYYENLDQIKSSETYISIQKELYKKVKTENGELLQKISAETPLKTGDKVTVRMILNTDRPMEFIHLKDMRSAGFEPLTVLSGYQWSNNLGYYQSTKDASTNFYIQYMPKGKYVFEYDLICNASGTFSNGISTLQNYYAPQMNARTKGEKVVIE